MGAVGEGFKTHKVGIAISFLTGFSFNLSTSFQNIMVFVLVASAFFHPDFKLVFKKAFNNHFIRGAFLFYLILVIGVLWSDAPTKDILSMLTRMILYLLCPLIFVFFDVRDNVRSFFLGFASCVVLSVLLSIISHITGLGFFHQSTGIHTELFGYKIDLFRGHTYQNFFVGLISIALLILIIEGQIKERIHKIFLIALIVIMFVDVFFIVTGRTGQILYILMFIIFIFHYLKGRKAVVFTFLLIVTSLLIINFSSNIKSGINNAINDIVSYKAGYANTSLGLRITFYKNSLKIFSESPIIGHGTGSFKNEYEKLNDEVMYSVGNPHNDYLWFAVEVGIIGLISFMIFISMTIYQVYKIPMPNRLMTLILVITYLISSINNSFFTDNLTGQFFVICICALFSNTLQEIKDDKHNHSSL